MNWRTMASSSDNSSPAAGRGFIPAQNDAERFLQKRTEELCRTALDKGIPRYTGFLSDREQLLAAAAAHRSGTECIRFWGGYEGAERAVFCVEPPDSWQEEPIATLRQKRGRAESIPNIEIIWERSLALVLTGPASEICFRIRMTPQKYMHLCWMTRQNSCVWN